MPPRLRYAGAVRLLGGSSPAVKAFDNLLGGALSVATAGGSDVALSLFDAKAEIIRLGHLLTAQVTDSVRGHGRYTRSERLQAAHGILVVTAFFEALDVVVEAAGLTDPELSRDEQITLVAGREPDRSWLSGLVNAALPVPGPEVSYRRLLSELTDWYAAATERLLQFLRDLQTWDTRTDDAVGQLPGLALERYEESHRRLAAEIPEFAIWTQRTEAQAVGRGLDALAATLLSITSGRALSRHRAALAEVYRAELTVPALRGDADGLTVPALGAAYVDPRFRVQEAGPQSSPADEDWWNAEPREDLAAMLTGYLTTPQAGRAPMLLLGQPGAGKSALTKILAARLPAADFLVVRVVLREVPAEAQIQDQIEAALRMTIGKTVAWTELAEEADGALPVILLDGFDELLQATGVHQSDYLQRVAAFQKREATLGRPVAVVVTSRLAVADRARLPADSLAVRLEPFGRAQVSRWLQTWNAENAGFGRRPLPADRVWCYPDLAGQPLLLLMLALYDAGGNTLHRDDDPLDITQLYERLLSDFALREVRRLHAGRPDDELRELVDDELMRLSVVAFAMFNRSRQWVTERELDDDLTALGIVPSRPAASEAFRSPLTVGQEVIGRFFFVQRAQAVQDGTRRLTYEFLHATFGEYLVARLVTRVLTETAREAQRRMPLRAGGPDDGLLRSLLGLEPLTARNTVLSFVSALLRDEDLATARTWLVNRIRTTLTWPEQALPSELPGLRDAEVPVARYSLNLMLLALACGEPLRATEIFPETADAASWLRNAALRWRGSLSSGRWIDVLQIISVRRTWTEDRRDIVLRLDPDAGVAEIDAFWSHKVAPGSPQRHSDGFPTHFNLRAALHSMDLSNNLSDDVLRHAVDPLLRRLPDTILRFGVHGPDDAESIAHGLVNLWLTSSLDDGPELLRAYERVATLLTGNDWITEAEHGSVADVLVVFVRSLSQDRDRLPGRDYVRLLYALQWLVELLPDPRPRESFARCLRVADDLSELDEASLRLLQDMRDTQARFGR
ncbi:MAG: ATP-binding protein [Actinoplanes sp.]